MPTQVTIPDDATKLAASQAAAAGFASIDDYLADLIRRQKGRNPHTEGPPATPRELGPLTRQATGLIDLPSQMSERDVLEAALIEQLGLGR